MATFTVPALLDASVRGRHIGSGRCAGNLHACSTCVQVSQVIYPLQSQSCDSLHALRRLLEKSSFERLSVKSNRVIFPARPKMSPDPDLNTGDARDASAAYSGVEGHVSPLACSLFEAVTLIKDTAVQLQWCASTSCALPRLDIDAPVKASHLSLFIRKLVEGYSPACVSVLMSVSDICL